MDTCLPSRPLTLARAGERIRLHRVTGDSGVRSHLASLGFVPGTELEVIRRESAGPMIVAIREGRLMLGHAMARHLWVV